MENLRKWLGRLLTGGVGWLAKPGENKRPVMKRINNLILVAIGGVLLILLANVWPKTVTPAVSAGGAGGQKNEAVSEETTSANHQPEITGLENMLAARLEQSLAKIAGVGVVEVTVNLASTNEKDFAINTATNSKTTEENDQKGGRRTINENTANDQMVLVRENDAAKEQPVVVKELKPEVKGVIVVAEGAVDSEVKANLMNAVQVYLDVPLYKVIVLPRKN